MKRETYIELWGHKAPGAFMIVDGGATEYFVEAHQKALIVLVHKRGEAAVRMTRINRRAGNKK